MGKPPAQIGTYQLRRPAAGVPSRRRVLKSPRSDDEGLALSPDPPGLSPDSLAGPKTGRDSGLDDASALGELDLSRSGELIAALGEPPNLELVLALETELVCLEHHRLQKIDRLEEATIITGELEDAVVRGPGNNDNELAAARAQERLRVASTLVQLKEDIDLGEADLVRTNNAKEAVLDECDRLRGDIAKLYAQRDSTADSVNSTIGQRIDLQLLCRKRASDIRGLYASDLNRREDLRRIEAEVTRQQEEAAAKAERNAAEVEEQKRMKDQVFQQSSEVRGKVIKARQHVIKLKRDLKDIQGKLKAVQADNSELVDMLSKFEPGFSEKIVARVAELNEEVRVTEAHLRQARENRDTHVAQCAAEVAKIVHVNKLAAENAKSSVDREAAQIEGRRIKIAELEAESVRIFEGLKKSMLEAKEEIKGMNKKLVHAESKCSEITEEVEMAMESHSANSNTLKENITTLSRNCDALDKVAKKKEAKLKLMKFESVKLTKVLESKRIKATGKVASTTTGTAMLKDAIRRTCENTARQRQLEIESQKLEESNAQKRLQLIREESEFVNQHAINMKSADERIFPARAAGYTARKELEKILAEVAIIEDHQHTAESVLKDKKQHRDELEARIAELGADKTKALLRQSRCKEMLADAQAECRLVLAEITEEREGLQLVWDIADVRQGIASIVHERLVSTHRHVHQQVLAYRAIMETLKSEIETAQEMRDALKKKLTDTYIEIRKNHDNFIARVQHETEQASNKYAMSAMRAKKYLHIQNWMEREGGRLDTVLRQAVEAKFAIDARESGGR